MRIQLAILIGLLLSGRIFAEPDAERLEKRLAGATGRERLELLVELATALREQDPTAVGITEEQRLLEAGE